MSSSTIQTVTGELCYLDPASTVLRRFTAPGASVNTGNYLPYEMPIHNGRPVSSQFTLDRNGFAILDHRSAVTDFTDRDEVSRVYPGEVADFVRSCTGADRVATLGWTLRRSAAPGENASQPQAALVHDDFSVNGARDRAAAAYADRFPDGLGYHRALITSLWRVFSTPPQDWPLAICDYTSVGPDEGLDNRLYFVDEIPADLYAEMPADWPGTSGFEFHHKPGHQWWYFPDMNRDEILLFTLNDSDHSRAWRVPHSAFRDTTARATVPRHSIEFRSIAYFELSGLPRPVSVKAHRAASAHGRGEPAMADWTETQVTTKISPRSVAATVSRLTGILAAKGMKVFAVIDQSEEARGAGLRLRETTLVIFGNPAAGTPVMDAAPLAALDLPLKVLVWADGSRTNVTYYSPAAIAERWGLSTDLAARLGGIDPLTDALVAG